MAGAFMSIDKEKAFEKKRLIMFILKAPVNIIKRFFLINQYKGTGHSFINFQIVTYVP
jgi:hypothetical protein